MEEIYTLEKHQKRLYDILHTIIVCLPNELIRIIVSFDQPILDRLVETGKIITNQHGNLMIRYKDEMYVCNSQNMCVLNSNGKQTRSFKLNYSIINIIDDTIYCRKTHDVYSTGVFDMNGNYVKEFSNNLLHNLIKINDNSFSYLKPGSDEGRTSFMALNMGYLCNVDNQGNIIHRSTERVYDLIRYNNVNYVGGLIDIFIHDDTCRRIGTIPISKHCDETRRMIIHQNMFIVVGSDLERKWGLFVFQMDGSYVCFHEMKGMVSSIQSFGNKIWITKYHESEITVLECNYTREHVTVKRKTCDC